MNAFEFQSELKKVLDRGAKEGVFAGQMSFAEYDGIIDIFGRQACGHVEKTLQAAQNSKEPVIVLPPNRLKPPGT